MLQPKFTITKKTNDDLVVIEQIHEWLKNTKFSKKLLEKKQNEALFLEAHHTVHLEGAQLTLKQSKQLWQGKKVVDVSLDDAKELQNYREAFALVAEYVNNNPITEGLIREMHKALVKDVRGNSAAPGKYRKIQSSIINFKTKEVIYKPPPVNQIQPMMTALVTWLNQETDIHPVLMAGIAQFQIVQIHPFLDGNGRTARLLSLVSLYRAGYDFKKFFSISDYYDKNQQEYYQAIQKVRQHDMDMSEWLEYFTTGLLTQLQKIKKPDKKKTPKLSAQKKLSKRRKYFE